MNRVENGRNLKFADKVTWVYGADPVMDFLNRVNASVFKRMQSPRGFGEMLDATSYSELCQSMDQVNEVRKEICERLKAKAGSHKNWNIRDAMDCM